MNRKAVLPLRIVKKTGFDFDWFPPKIGGQSRMQLRF
jgi:hypothetical protein